jgi:hypothetical protein
MIQGLEFCKDGWDYHKSVGGWSVEKKEYGTWMFYAKFSSKRAAINYIKQKLAEQNRTESV